MKYTIMECECCGKRFYREHWEGGYIDHVVNFVGNRGVYVNRNDIKDMASEIVFDGNNIRELRYIKEFLHCFMMWDCFPEDFKNSVEKIVKAIIAKIADAKEEVKNLEKSISPLVLAMFKGEDIDDAYFDLFDECYEGVIHNG
jgi:hypothetical protein